MRGNRRGNKGPLPLARYPSTPGPPDTPMKLTPSACVAAICPPGQGVRKCSDGRSLYLEVSGTTGSKRWFLKYTRPDGRPNRLALGAFPDTTLKAARDIAQAARELVAQGIDPVQDRQVQRERAQVAAVNTFRAVAQETFDTRKSGWTPQYAAKWWRYIEADLFDTLGDRPVASIEPPDLLREVRRIEARGVVEIAHRVMKGAEVVFAHAIGKGLITRNPALDVQPLIKAKPPAVPHPAVLDRKALGQMLRDLAVYAEGEGRHLAVQHACQMQLLTAQRPHTVLHMLWQDIDLDAKEWRIPAAVMKGRLSAKVRGKPHVVALSRQALTIIKVQRRAVPKDVPFVFPSTIASRQRTTPLSENTCNLAFQRLGFEQTSHGCRAQFLTIVQEDLH
ncbi:MAG: DUF4102 domain-containing protein, partial [Variovorax sp.]